MRVWLRARAVSSVTQVSTDISGKGTNYQVCTEIRDIELPTGYYFGMSASTGGLAGACYTDTHTHTETRGLTLRSCSTRAGGGTHR